MRAGAVLVVHASVDVVFAQQVTANLRARQVEAELEPWQVNPGQRIGEVLAGAARHAGDVLVLLTPRSASAAWWFAQLAGGVPEGFLAGRRVTVVSRGLVVSHVP